jgi:hypothetical protein
MKALMYILGTVFGLFGILALLRTIEHLVTGTGLIPSQLLIALVALLIAGVCFKKARKGPAGKVE